LDIFTVAALVMATASEETAGPRSSTPCDQDLWHTDLVASRR